MTTQGAPRNTRKTVAAKANPLVKPQASSSADEEFDVDAWLAKRGLTAKRRMRIGGELFEFNKSVTPDVLIAYQAAYKADDYPLALSKLLADPGQADEFTAAYARQPQPVMPEDQTEYLVSLINFVLVGDADLRVKDDAEEKMGESSAS